MAVSQKNLLFAETYPSGRPAFFAVRFLTHLLRRGAAFAVKSDGVVLLTAVVTAEDRTHYKKPISFWNDHLCSMTGLSRERLFDARKRCVAAGWLSYCEGAHGRAPVYFVTVPGGDAEIDCSIIGETPADEMVRELGRISRPNSPPMSDSIDDRSPTQSTTHSSLFPGALNPPPPSHSRHQVGSVIFEAGLPTEFIRTSGEEEDSSKRTKPGSRAAASGDCSRAGIEPEKFRQLVDRLRAVGVNLAESTLRESIEVHRQRGQEPSKVEQVISHLEERQLVWKGKPLRPYGGGAAVRRLTDGELVELPPGEGWPKNADPIWAREWARELERRSRAAQAAREQVASKADESAERESWRQLELQFQGELQRLSANPAEVVEMLARSGQEQLAKRARMKPESIGTPDSVVRKAVLRLLQGAGIT